MVGVVWSLRVAGHGPSAARLERLSHVALRGLCAIRSAYELAKDWSLVSGSDFDSQCPGNPNYSGHKGCAEIHTHCGCSDFYDRMLERSCSPVFKCQPGHK